jgi:hypothetical protein
MFLIYQEPLQPHIILGPRQVELRVAQGLNTILCPSHLLILNRITVCTEESTGKLSLSIEILVQNPICCCIRTVCGILLKPVLSPFSQNWHHLASRILRK